MYFPFPCFLFLSHIRYISAQLGFHSTSVYTRLACRLWRCNYYSHRNSLRSSSNPFMSVRIPSIAVQLECHKTFSCIRWWRRRKPYRYYSHRNSWDSLWDQLLFVVYLFLYWFRVLSGFSVISAMSGSLSHTGNRSREVKVRRVVEEVFSWSFVIM